MALKRIQINEGPAMVDIINLVPGNDLSFQLTLAHDITGSTFEAAIHSITEEPIASFTISGVEPTVSGVVGISMPSDSTTLVEQNSHWYFDEIHNGLRRTLMAGNVEVYLK